MLSCRAVGCTMKITRLEYNSIEENWSWLGYVSINIHLFVVRAKRGNPCIPNSSLFFLSIVVDDVVVCVFFIDLLSFCFICFFSLFFFCLLSRVHCALFLLATNAKLLVGSDYFQSVSVSFVESHVSILVSIIHLIPTLTSNVEDGGRRCASSSSSLSCAPQNIMPEKQIDNISRPNHRLFYHARSIRPLRSNRYKYPNEIRFFFLPFQHFGFLFFFYRFQC